jgi:hypothetical protein
LLSTAALPTGAAIFSPLPFQAGIYGPSVMSDSQKNKKEKPGKAELLRLLGEALAREHRSRERIGLLEAELEECRRQVDHCRAEPGLDGRPGSKIPFRIDYYRTGEKAPLQGVIEHLPSRQKNAFLGAGLAVISQFLQKYLPGDR